jgi:protein involved in polysaccharide export with SLBB domain
VTVTGRGEFQAAADVVFLQGRVVTPGAYPLRSGSTHAPYTVWDLLQDGGGLLPDGNPGGIVVYRRRTSALENVQQEDLQRVLQSVNAEASQSAAMSVQTDEAAEAISQTVGHNLQQVMSTPGGISIVLPPRTVRESDWVSAIPVDGRNLVATRGAEDNLALEPGDTVMVPRRVNTVMVLGAVPRSGAVPFVQGQTADYYLNESGGLREDSAASRMVVVHANGAVEPIKRTQTLEPGDVVVVPTRHIVRTVRTESELQTWLRTIVPLATAALVF